MAEKIVLAGPASEDLGKSLSAKMGLALLKAEFKVFPDGESKFTLNEGVAGRTVFVVQSAYPPVDGHIFQLMLASHKLSQEGARVTAVVPYLAYARQDKEFLPGEGVSLGFVAHLMRSAGIRRLATVDIHSAEGLSFFSFPAYSVSAIPLLVEKVRALGLSSPAVISPDFGGSKRTEAFAQLYGAPFLRLSKTRDRTNGLVKIKDEEIDVKGKDVVIVDDVVSTGSTIVAAAEAVMKHGARAVAVACSHGLFVGDAAEKLDRVGVKTIICTNTVPGKYNKADITDTLASHLGTVEE